MIRVMVRGNDVPNRFSGCESFDLANGVLGRSNITSAFDRDNVVAENHEHARVRSGNDKHTIIESQRRAITWHILGYRN